MKAYERYKDSCVAWLGKIPKYWELPKLRKIFIERSTKVSDKDYPALSVGYMGVVPQLETAAKTNDGDNRKLICKGDFAINSRSDRKGAGGISEYNGSASNIIIVLKPHENINGKFYHYLLRSHYFSEEFYRNGHGIVSDLWTTGWDTMRNIFIPLPPLSEQNQIAKFLDEKISKLNKLISIRQQEISELRELKKAIINKAVTKGLRDVPMKDSGVAWLGKIPEAWELVRGKNFFYNRKDINKNNQCSNILSLTLKGVINNDAENPIGLSPKDYASYQIFDRNNLVFKLIDLENVSTSRVGLVHEHGIMSSAYIRLINRYECNIRYFYFQYYNLYLRNVYNGLGAGVRSTMSASDLLNMLIMIPPLAEQNEIADYLDKKCSQIDALITNHEKQITELNELKARLISDAVTGKIDVR